MILYLKLSKLDLNSLIATTTLFVFIILNGCEFVSKKTNLKIDSTKKGTHNLTFSYNDIHLTNQGQRLFKSNCNMCHAILKTDNYLEGVVQRLGVNYLKIYLTRQDSLIKSKNKYAIELKKAYGNSGNSHNFQFSDKELDAIIAYLLKYSN